MFTPNTEIGARVEADHKRLRHLSAELKAFLADDVEPRHFTPWKLAALTRLRDFENQLAKHFDLEEDGGFIDDLLGLAPESSNSISHLKEEHQSMLGEISAIIGMVKSYRFPSEVDVPLLRARVKTFLASLKKHESAETALLYDAHFQVNGTGD